MALRLLALGGLGEIGMNCLLIERDGEALIVDCGVKFPGPDVHGVDLLVPDFRPLLARRDALRGLLLTHGHEDHIGAVPYLLQELPGLPVYGSRFTLALLHAKLEELGIAATLHELSPRVSITLGGFSIEPLRVAHSIPDGLALAITCAEGTIVHTGDFKIDETPLDGEVTDLTRFGELGQRGVRCLLSDSTNAMVAGACPSERAVTPGLAEAIRDAPGRVVVALFSSHIHRVQQLLDLAAAAKRRVVLNGRRIDQNVTCAAELRLLQIPPGLLLAPESAGSVSARELLVLSTGAQGEPRSGLVRLASGDHPYIALEAGDRVVFSSRYIPGNELAIGALQNALVRLGVDVIAEPEHHVHVSGHAYSDDERQILQLVRPHSFIPIHGEARHLKAHREIALSCGLAKDRCLLAFNGDVVELTDAGPRLAGRIELHRIYLDRATRDELPEPLVRERQLLAESGLIAIVLVLDSATGELQRPPELISRGVLPPDPEHFWKEARRRVTEELAEMPHALWMDFSAIEDVAARAVRRYCRKVMARRPMVLPFVVKI
jgi:ribonuclease J